MSIHRYRIGERLDHEDGQTAPNGEGFDIKFIASTERLASDGGIIPVDAWRLDQFKTNPRFISNHDTSGWNGGITDTVVGTVVDIRVETDLPTDKAPGGRGLVAYVRFANTSFAREMRTLYMDGDLDAVSVQWDWRTEKTRDPTEEEDEKYGGKLSWVGIRTDLLELSSVILGADPGALALRGRVEEAVARCRSKGIDLPSITRAMESGPDNSSTNSVTLVNDSDQTVTTGTTTSANTITSLQGDELVWGPDNWGSDRIDHVDSGALVDAITSLRDTMQAMDLWMAQGFELRQTLGDSANAFSSLISGDEVGEKIEIEDRSFEDIMTTMRNATTVEELEGILEEFKTVFDEQLASIKGEKIEEVEEVADETFDPDDVYEDGGGVKSDAEVDAEVVDEEVSGDVEAGEEAEGSEKEPEDPDEISAKDTEDHNEQGGDHDVHLKAVFGDSEEEAEQAA